jgi:hypothetical protein
LSHNRSRLSHICLSCHIIGLFCLCVSSLLTRMRTSEVQGRLLCRPPRPIVGLFYLCRSLLTCMRTSEVLGRLLWRPPRPIVGLFYVCRSLLTHTQTSEVLGRLPWRPPRPPIAAPSSKGRIVGLFYVCRSLLTHMRTSDVEAAEACYRRALLQEPQDVVTLCHLGGLLLRLVSLSQNIFTYITIS